MITKNKLNYITSKEAAEILGFSQDHVRKLINQGKIKATKFGSTWVIPKKNIAHIHRQRFRKPKENHEDGSN